MTTVPRLTTPVPRLTKGRGVKGPEPFGCFNTGHAPVILRSGASGKYIVGPELAVDAARDAHLFHARKRKFGKGRDAAWVYKTRKPAVAKFEELRAAMMDANDRMRAEYRQAKADAASPDPETAIRGATATADF
jgi:hypothetical protein